MRSWIFRPCKLWNKHFSRLNFSCSHSLDLHFEVNYRKRRMKRRRLSFFFFNQSYRVSFGMSHSTSLSSRNITIPYILEDCRYFSLSYTLLPAFILRSRFFCIWNNLFSSESHYNSNFDMYSVIFLIKNIKKSKWFAELRIQMRTYKSADVIKRNQFLMVATVLRIYRIDLILSICICMWTRWIGYVCTKSCFKLLMKI